MSYNKSFFKALDYDSLNTSKKILLNIGLFFCFCIIPIIFLIASKSTTTIDHIYTSNYQIYEIGKNDIIEQKIYIKNPIQALSLYIATGGERSNTGTVKISVIGENILAQKEQPIENLTDWSSLLVPIKKNNIKNEWITIKIEGENVEKGSSIFLLFDKANINFKNATINHISQNNSLCMRYVERISYSMLLNGLFMIALLYGIVFLVGYCYLNRKNIFKITGVCTSLFLEILFIHFYGTQVAHHQLDYLNKFYFIIITMIMVAIIGTLYLLKKKIKIEKLAIFTIFCFGCIYLFILPPFSAPDEPVHFETAYHDSNLLLFQKPKDDKRAFARKSDNEFLSNFMTTKPTKNTYKLWIANILENKKIDNTYQEMNMSSIILTSPIFAHFPQAIGITLAKIFNLNSGTLLVFGRFTGLLFYLFCIYWAIKRIPFGKMILFVISMFPMMLEQISSYSYDLTLNGLSFFLTAYILNLIYEKTHVETKDIIIIAITIYLLSPIKIVYFFIIGMCLFIPKNKYKSKILANFIFITSAIGSIIIHNLSQITNISSSDSLTYIAERGYSITDMLQNIPYAFSVFINTLFNYSQFYLNSIIGNNLGWLEIPVSTFIIFGFLMILFLEIGRSYKKQQVQVIERIGYMAIFFIIFVSILFSMWLSWTPITSDTIQGVQGRYLLPILPLLCFSFINMKKINFKSSISANIFIICMLNVFAILDVLKITFGR